MKRIFDFSVSLILLLLTSPILLTFMFLVWRQDKHSPFYVAPRVGKKEKLFNIIKLRSMIVNADKSGVDSTSANDMRITKVGKLIRKYKLDELTQMMNVLKGEMSLVGPRPNVQRDVALYTNEEKNLLNIRPGITDLSSIVFSDENDILKDSKDPDLDYNKLIRPWKSRLGLFYVSNRTLIMDVKLVYATAMAIVSKRRALKTVVKILEKHKAPEKLIQVAKRQQRLEPYPPPGSDKIVESREVSA